MTNPTEDLQIALQDIIKVDKTDGRADSPLHPTCSHRKMCNFLEMLQRAVLHGGWRNLQNEGLLTDITNTLNHAACKQVLLSSLAKNADDIAASYIKTITSLTQHAMLPAAQENEDEAYPEDNFALAQLKTFISVCVINSLLMHLWDCTEGRPADKLDFDMEIVDKMGRKILKACVPPCIVLCASHQQPHPWTDIRSRQVTQELLQTLCKISSITDVPQLLSGSKQASTTKRDDKWMTEGCFGDVLSILRHRLTRQSWKQEPASRQAFHWCLVQVKHPHLGDHLEFILPPALLFVDDYKVENKILGIGCLQHIIDNVDPTELSWYGRSLVIYEALQHLLYSQEAALLDVLYPCLLAILGVIEKAPHKADEIRKPNCYDMVFQTILTNMEFEQKLILRRVHAKCLAAFIDKMAITVLRHMKRLLRVLLNFLEVYDGAEQTARMDILCALKALIVQAWPRIPNHCDAILKSLLRLLYDVTTCDADDISKTVQSELISRTEECLLLLKRCCGTKVDQTLQSIEGCEATNQLIDQCLQRVTSGT